MTTRTASQAAMILATLGGIFMLAMAFGVMPFKYAIFLGVVCFVVAGLVKKMGSTGSSGY